jgi:hypothetical protein
VGDATALCSKRPSSQIETAQSGPTAPQCAKGQAQPRCLHCGQETVVARLTRERDEALEREKASAKVLRIISTSPGELKPIFQAMLENAVRICEAFFGNLACVVPTPL